MARPAAARRTRPAKDAARDLPPARRAYARRVDGRPAAPGAVLGSQAVRRSRPRPVMVASAARPPRTQAFKTATQPSKPAPAPRRRAGGELHARGARASATGAGAGRPRADDDPGRQYYDREVFMAAGAPRPEPAARRAAARRARRALVPLRPGRERGEACARAVEGGRREDGHAQGPRRRPRPSRASLPAAGRGAGAS